jgi:hypothetical protein
MLFKNSDRTSKRTPHFTITKINWLTLFKFKPIVMYGSECWTLFQSDGQKKDVCERKVLRTVYGNIQGGDIWRSRDNSELYALYREPKLTAIIRMASLRWAGHVQRMEDEQMPKRLLYAKKPVGEGMWEDQEQDGWMKLTQILGEWE